MMSEDAGCAKRFLYALFAAVVKPISDLRLLISGVSPILIALCSLLLAPCSALYAQQPGKVYLIGFLTTGSVVTANPEWLVAFWQSLRDLGYVEGKNMVIERRGADWQRERLPKLAAELVRLKVDVIVTNGSGDARAAKEATSAIPIVIILSGDAVRMGLVASLARPGGNITGLATQRIELSGKRLELLKEIVPKLSRVAVFTTSTSQDYPQTLKEIELAGRGLEIKLQILDVRSSKDIETAFQAAVKERAEAVLVRVSGPVLSSHRTKVPALAVKNRLAVVYETEEDVEAGGLMSYGTDRTEAYRRAAVYVDKILKGAKPADLPVEQPIKFEFIINLKAAKQIGLTIPPNVLARADRVIR
jgi:putative tryptophan/tyrosine transport system substrate-binding protein